MHGSTSASPLRSLWTSLKRLGNSLKRLRSERKVLWDREKWFKERESTIFDAAHTRRGLKNEHEIAQKNGYLIFYRKNRKSPSKNEREWRWTSEMRSNNSVWYSRNQKRAVLYRAVLYHTLLKIGIMCYHWPEEAEWSSTVGRTANVDKREEAHKTKYQNGKSG